MKIIFIIFLILFQYFFYSFLVKFWQLLKITWFYQENAIPKKYVYRIVNMIELSETQLDLVCARLAQGQKYMGLFLY